MPDFGTDHEILTTALSWLQDGHEVAMVTVLRTWGSSPRPPGSLMVMRRDGIHAGSVSGGCVEQDLVQRYRDYDLSENYPVILDYGVNRVDAMRFGLPCGGRLELLVESLTDSEQLQQIVDAMQSHELLERQLDLNTGEVTLREATADQVFEYSHQSVHKIFGPQWTMLLIGAGHLSQYVSGIALMLGYRVIVCDPRDEYTQAWQVKGTEVTHLMPDDAVKTFIRHARGIVVALTHDPKLDDMALLEALCSQAFYVGAIGSKRNCEQRRLRLREMGLGDSQLQRLHAPVGIPIGSYTPPEIAVSIMAEITRERNAVNIAMKPSVSLV